MNEYLISIKPEYANKILTGEKKVEFRKQIFWSTRLSPYPKRFWIYASNPVQKIIGFFNAGIFENCQPYRLWSIFQDRSGITEDKFLQYFKNHLDKKVWGIRIEKTLGIEPVIPYEGFKPPMSYRILDQEEKQRLGLL